jgi:hypothetical protein
MNDIFLELASEWESQRCFEHIYIPEYDILQVEKQLFQSQDSQYY